MRFNKKKVAKGALVGARTVGDIILLILKAIGTVLLVALTTLAILACVFSIYINTNMNTDLDVNLSDFSLAQTSEIFYLDSNTGKYVKLASLYDEENRSWVVYSDIPKNLEHAAVAIEDKRFYDHHGVDWYRTVAAFGNMFLGMRDNFGGSTLTQQLIKNLTEYDDVTVKRKLTEIFRAIEFEKSYTKEEIMEWYLNTIYLGQGCWGVGSAANMYFGKNIKDLTLAECASLIGITNNPSLFDPYIDEKANKERQETILREMLKQGYISENEYEKALSQKLVFKQGTSSGSETSGEFYSWFVDAVIEDVINDLRIEKGISRDLATRLLYTAGYRVFATIDLKAQNIVDDIYTNRDEMPTGYYQSETQDLQSAIVILDLTTGNIVAMAGGFDKKVGDRIFNRATDMKKPPGSTIKPIASYGPAMEYGYIMPYTIYNDAPDVKLSGTDWYPDNDTYTNAGLVTIRYALQDSINTVAAQLVDKLTPEISYNFLKNKLGVSSLVDEDMNYAPMALGQLTNGISVRELTDAFSCFPNNGIFIEGRTYTHIEDMAGNMVYDNVPKTNVALSDITAYYMTDMLQNVVNRGTGYTARLENMPAGGKTGASGNWRDRWFVGFTPYYVSAVWTGYDMPEYMGSFNPATQLWKKVMDRLHEDLEPKSFSRPENMKEVTVCIDSGQLASDLCAKDVRGNHTMTLYMQNSAIPVSVCDIHVKAEVCKDSRGLFSDDCPQDSKVEMSVLDLKNRTPGSVLTPVIMDRTTNLEIKYVLEEMKPCLLHKRDPVTGWRIDPKTGYLVDPSNENMLHDTVTGKLYDKLSGWEIDRKTGMLIDPDSGELIDPWSGEVVIPETPIPSDAPDVIPRPPTDTPTPLPSTAPTPSPSTAPSTSPTPSPGTIPENEPTQQPGESGLPPAGGDNQGGTPEPPDIPPSTLPPDSGPESSPPDNSGEANSGTA